jgi:hypothetical protein
VRIWRCEINCGCYIIRPFEAWGETLWSLTKGVFYICAIIIMVWLTHTILTGKMS